MCIGYCKYYTILHKGHELPQILLSCVCLCVGGCVSWNQSLEDTEGWMYKELIEVKECKSSLSSSTTAVSEPLWENACLFNKQSFLGMSRVQTLPFHT